MGDKLGRNDPENFMNPSGQNGNPKRSFQIIFVKFSHKFNKKSLILRLCLRFTDSRIIKGPDLFFLKARTDRVQSKNNKYIHHF
jgi:hypothetical protein